MKRNAQAFRLAGGIVFHKAGIAPDRLMGLDEAAGRTVKHTLAGDS